MSRRTVTVLGSTGSVGTQALELLARDPSRFALVGLSAGGGNVELLVEQARAHRVPVVAVADVVAAAVVRDLLPGVEVLSGPDAAADLAGRGADVVLNAITGSVGLLPTLAALRAGSTLALANKESLVVGGALVRAATVRPDQIVPVDSEHSAIAQALRSGARAEVRRLVLTASGGPFRGWSADAVARATPEQALAHPTWAMGPVITVNSASLMNKGLELIEAHLLFDVPVDDVAVVVHPQSVVHSMVEFVDGSTIAQASPPDMRLPIALGLAWPERVAGAASPCDWSTATSWTFEPLDEVVFPAVRLAREAVAASATHPAVYNAANEEGVAAFLAGRIAFGDVVTTVEKVLAEHEGTTADGTTLDVVLEVERWARARANEVLAV
ncbi:1-deoxy-D-xylulose-5-phosphate reductoisomerase [Cellulomonas oligotrophica]|uniref:1-deoxy-D-xylulose 5-phosphate reductoisomerase n=1 Tax=Cellulomonas oligotrophica TaxID=931536 RepID=A0A7Y9FJG7_9CELL|nr:1-deoxy-D-xylulose-5-phosphate reductoisomerase [Cellulomonas oligotrophica]NYD88137.1 1-deoxy-D-xylulose-5-phosphate reductoisomerase [Cellulomonas oligotrophica]GIG33645.1 1-deoxy-D-xylulose 5-phosphate reductoisomerase [Cellulomonas oligotrophica]